MKLEVKYYPSVTKTVQTAEKFFVEDPETGICLSVHLGVAEFVKWSSARQQYDSLEFSCFRSKLTPALLIALVDAYQKRKS